MKSVFSLEHIEVISAEVFFDESTVTKVKETPTLLQYESQHFRCRVRLRLMESVSDAHWSIGLVQACDGMFLENRYGEAGSSFWEFHPIRSARHRMVNDSDGRQYPFYSQSSSKCEVCPGHVQEVTVTLHYEDHFYPTVAWQLPYCGGASLTEVLRKQYFWIWLVAIERGSSKDGNYHFFNVNDDKIHVLRTMRWSYSLHMKFDLTKAVGKRLQMLDDVQKESPRVYSTNRPIPISALSPPHCNATQSLLWYPRSCDEKPRILVPPRQIIVPWEMWMRDMLPGREKSYYQKPDECKLVGEWSRDEEMGLTEMPGRGHQNVLPTVSYRQYRHPTSPKSVSKYFAMGRLAYCSLKNQCLRQASRSLSRSTPRLITD